VLSRLEPSFSHGPLNQREALSERRESAWRSSPERDGSQAYVSTGRQTVPLTAPLGPLICRGHSPTSAAISAPATFTHRSLIPTCPAPIQRPPGQWCADVLGWTFQPAIPTPSGDDHMLAYSEAGGGGIHPGRAG
jgi:hypothetical protein